MPCLIELLDNMLNCVHKQNVKDIHETSFLAYRFLIELLKLCTYVKPNTYPPLVRHSLEIIKTNYQELESIEALADILSVSKAHLIREFSRYVGTSPGKFLLNTRLEHAFNLRSTGGTLDEIAAKVGFLNGNYLGKVLRRRFGVNYSSLNSKTT